MKHPPRSYERARASTLAGAVWALLSVATGCVDGGAFFTESPTLLPFPEVAAGAGGGFAAPGDMPDAAAGGSAAGGSGSDSEGGGGPGMAAAGGSGGAEPGDSDTGEDGRGGGSDSDGSDDGEPKDDDSGEDDSGEDDSGEDGEPGEPDEPGSGGVTTPPPSDGSCGGQCERNGGRCLEGTCIFDCDAPDSCTEEQVLCPPGRPCEVRCGDRSCVNNVVCRTFASCDIQCEGEGSCASEVICEGDCYVTCSGAHSCGGGLGGSVQLLDLECSGAQSCGSTVQCEGVECHLSCTGPESCAMVRTFAVDNTVSCSGAGSCGTDVTCLGASCGVECANNACDGNVECHALDCDLPGDD